MSAEHYNDKIMFIIGVIKQKNTDGGLTQVIVTSKSMQDLFAIFKIGVWNVRGLTHKEIELQRELNFNLMDVDIVIILRLKRSLKFRPNWRTTY